MALEERKLEKFEHVLVASMETPWAYSQVVHSGYQYLLLSAGSTLEPHTPDAGSQELHSILQVFEGSVLVENWRYRRPITFLALADISLICAEQLRSEDIISQRYLF